MRPGAGLALAWALLCGMAPVAAAEALCSTDVVTLGDSEAVVRERCGAPVEQRSSCGAVIDGDRAGTTPQPSIDKPCVNLDQWNYRSASGRPSTVLKFEAGRLKSIDDDRSATSPNDR